MFEPHNSRSRTLDPTCFPEPFLQPDRITLPGIILSPKKSIKGRSWGLPGPITRVSLGKEHQTGAGSMIELFLHYNEFPSTCAELNLPPKSISLEDKKPSRLRGSEDEGAGEVAAAIKRFCYSRITITNISAEVQTIWLFFPSTPAQGSQGGFYQPRPAVQPLQNTRPVFYSGSHCVLEERLFIQLGKFFLCPLDSPSN